MQVLLAHHFCPFGKTVSTLPLALHIPPLLLNCFRYDCTSWIVSCGYSNSSVECEGCCFMSLFSFFLHIFYSFVSQWYTNVFRILPCKIGYTRTSFMYPWRCIQQSELAPASSFALVLRHKPFSFVWATLVATNDFPYGIAWFCNTVCVSVDLLKTEDIFLWPENGVVGGLRWYLLVVVRVLWNQKVAFKQMSLFFHMSDLYRGFRLQYY